MPYPAKTSANDIVDEAILIIEQEGEAALTVANLAKQIGIRAPSLYKHFASRDHILAAVEELSFKRLGIVLTAAIEESADQPLTDTFYAYRKFANENPNIYKLIFSDTRLDKKHAEEIRQSAAKPIFGLFASDHPDLALKQARLVTAYVHGFVSMEINGAFRLGGDIDDAFKFGVEFLVKLIAQASPS